MVSQTYVGFSIVGGPDGSCGQAHLQFLPLTLPCSVPGLLGVPHGERERLAPAATPGMPKNVFFLDTVC